MKNMDQNTKNNFYGLLQSQSSRAMKFLAILMMGTFLISCDKLNEVEDALEDVREEQEARTFKAELGGLNNSGVTGEVIIQYLQDGKFEVMVKARNLAPNMVHPQHIHGFGFMDKSPKDAVCPPMSAAGDDGLLTLVDGLPFYGPVLVSLDDNVAHLDGGDFPMANANGQLNYLQYTTLKAMLMAIDEANDGNQTMENLALDKRVIVLHGAYVMDDMVVPAGTEGAEYVATLPVACGELKEVY